MKKYILLLLSISLTGCGLFSSSSSSNGKVTHLPKAPKTVVPGGTSNKWRYIGTSNDGMLVIEINDGTIVKSEAKNGTHIATFTDRKMVTSITKFAYPPNQPKFKYLISNWQIDCDNKKYIILDSKLYNTSGSEIGQYNYRKNPDVKWLKFADGSIANLEYDYVCNNKNRNLGY